MTRVKNRGRNGSSIKRNATTVNPPLTSLLGTIPQVQENDSITVLLNEVTVFAMPDSAGAGAFNLYGQSNPANSDSWNGYADNYKEYRTLSVEVEWIPIQMYDSSLEIEASYVDTPWYSFIDHTSTSHTGTSTLVATGFETLKLHPFNKGFKRFVRMDSIEECVFTPTSSPVNLYSANFVAEYTSTTSLPRAQPVGAAHIRRKVQFRARDHGVLLKKEKEIEDLKQKISNIKSSVTNQ